jgi:hypothetical protein
MNEENARATLRQVILEGLIDDRAMARRLAMCPSDDMEAAISRIIDRLLDKSIVWVWPILISGE